ncbi:MAG: hypothetical protein HY985_02475 [Magnetospirillum sp.]|nr:hypothetical protein [Magnetospirillum sp.]
MASHSGPLLVDTNAILECHRTASWRALTQRYRTEAVEKCVEETLTGFQNRRPELQIDQVELRRSLAAVHAVADADLAQALAREARIVDLDPGEKHLWAHALTRADAWVLCGPDASSLRIGIRLGLRDRLVSLEGLLNDIGHRSNPQLKVQYAKRWHEAKLSDLASLETGISR